MLVSYIKCVVVITFASDGSGHVVEVELLGGSVIWSLDNKSVREMVNEPSTAHLSLNMEWSIDPHSPDLTVSCSWDWLSIIDVKNIPLL